MWKCSTNSNYIHFKRSVLLNNPSPYFSILILTMTISKIDGEWLLSSHPSHYVTKKFISSILKIITAINKNFLSASNEDFKINIILSFLGVVMVFLILAIFILFIQLKNLQNNGHSSTLPPQPPRSTNARKLEGCWPWCQAPQNNDRTEVEPEIA